MSLGTPRTPVAWIAVAATAMAGCGDDLLLERERPNFPPETRLTSSPPDSTDGTNYRVRLAWLGTDPDGGIDHYDFILVDHPAMDSCIECDPNDPNTVVVTPPAADDPRWTATGSIDTTIVTRADTLRVNPIPPDTVVTDPDLAEHNRLVRLQSFERWHTFFVRAVDDRNQADHTPSYVSFNSTTLAPEVFLLPPVDPRRADFHCPTNVAFSWDGRDVVDNATVIAPIASRWVIIPARKIPNGTYIGYPDSLYRLPVGRQWSLWRRWDAADGSGRRATVTGLQPVGSTFGVGWYLFAVQAMDEAGAVTPVFDATTVGNNNVARVMVLADTSPTLFVDGGSLGGWTFVGPPRGISVTAAAGQPIRFRWRADASAYDGHIVAYRYGWNILNPENDDEWRDCGLCTETPPPLRAFDSGIQRFSVEAIDNFGGSVRGEIEIVIHAVTRRRDLLFVDDTGYFDGDPTMQEQREDDRWLAVIDSLRDRQPFAFDPVLDIYDVRAARREPPPISLVFDYKTVVWCAREGVGSCALREITQFFDPFVNQNLVVRFNFLQIYTENQGEIWVSGQQPTNYMWSFRGRLRPYPFNVTNCDDPIMPHPQEDSVGVHSFLWRMGAEAVDHGAGGQGQQIRESINHYCIGFRRATPQGYESQIFKSSFDEDHEHELEILTADVEMPPAGGKTYTTTSPPGVGHTHTVTLSEPQLRQLARGDVLAGIQTSESDIPHPHSHTFTLVDQTGLWGAPLTLEPERSDWALPANPTLNPRGGRPSVEIYNMPAYLAAQTPPLRPDAHIWTSLYEYVSATPADPDAGVVYPLTADGQPAIILRKTNATDRDYSRAFCGFETWRLTARSHVALADHILLRHFRLGLPD